MRCLMKSNGRSGRHVVVRDVGGVGPAVSGQTATHSSIIAPCPAGCRTSTIPWSGWHFQTLRGSTLSSIRRYRDFQKAGLLCPLANPSVTIPPSSSARSGCVADGFCGGRSSGVSHITNCTYHPSKLRLTTSSENWFGAQGFWRTPYPYGKPGIGGPFNGTIGIEGSSAIAMVYLRDGTGLVCGATAWRLHRTRSASKHITRSR